MKTIYFTLLLFSVTALASREVISSRGQASGYCYGGFGSYLCYDQIDERARQDSAREAGFQCQLKNGRINFMADYCYSYCNPPYMPNNRDAFVTCTASCSYGCETGS